MRVNSLHSWPIQIAVSAFLLCVVIVAAFPFAHAQERGVSGDIESKNDAVWSKVEDDNLSFRETVSLLAKWHSTKESTVRNAIASGSISASEGNKVRQSLIDEDLQHLREFFERQARGKHGQYSQKQKAAWESLPQVIGNKRFPDTGREYAAMCEPHLGVPPAFEMSDGVTIPTTVKGVEQALPVPNHSCDNPSLQAGICQPGSTIMRFTGRTRDGRELPDVVWVAFARNEGGFGSEKVSLGIQMIGYNKKTGATGFFKGAPFITELDASKPENYPAKGFIPSSDDPAFDKFFFPPKGFQCVECHQSDPFVHNPYIDAAPLPGNPDEPVLPILDDPNPPYFVIGAPEWDMRTIHIEGNGCVSCHRVGMRTLEDFIDDRWDPNQHMPPHDPGSMKKDLQELIDAWLNGPENTPGAHWVVPPAGSAEGQIVGDDYPFKNKFNTPNREVFAWYQEQVKAGKLEAAPWSIRNSVKQFDDRIPELSSEDLSGVDKAIHARIDAASARIWADADDLSEDDIIERLAKWHAAKESIITKALAKGELTATAASALRRSIVRDELNGLRGLLGEREDEDDEDWDDEDEDGEDWDDEDEDGEDWDDEDEDDEDEDEDELTLNAAQKSWRHGPENNHYGIRLSASEYAKMVEPELGIPPVVDCGANVEIPIFVDRKRYVGDPGIHCCDNPSLQMGDCMSGSSLGRHEGRTRDGKRLPDVVWVSFARHDGRANVFGHEVGNSVQLIGYNKKTGATAFFESGDNSRWVRADPKTNRLVGVLPGIDNPRAFDHAYSTPGATQCVECHQNDPFIHNPFIDAARLPGDPSQPVVPEIAGPETPYYVIGASHWDMRTIHIEGNSCFECHRIGMKTIEEFIGDGWDPNKHMPPGDPGSMKKDFDQLLRAWIKGPEKTPGCDWIIPPAGDAPTRVVGDDYPFKAWFNQPNEDAIRKLNRKPRRIPEPNR